MFSTRKFLLYNNSLLKRHITGASYIYNYLLENKIKKVGLYSGGSIMPLVDKFFKGDIEYYINTHEQSLGHTATGYAKSSSKCGVGIVTSGPGLTNMVTPLLDATNDSTPFVLFSGQVSLDSMGTNAFQECDAVNITRPVTKWSYCIKNVNELPSVLDSAFNIATLGKPGSVHIDLPKDILITDFNVEKAEKIYPRYIYPKYNESHLNSFIKEDFIKVASIINNSKRPVFYLGQGSNNYSKKLTKLIEKTNIPVTTTIHAMGVYDETKPLSLKFLGMHGSYAANNAIQESDCIIALGSRFDDRTTGNTKKYAPKAIQAYNKGKGGIIHVNIEKSEMNKTIKSHYNFNMDVGKFIDNINPFLIKKSSNSKWLHKINQWKIDYPFVIDNIDNNTIKTQEVILGINNSLKKNNLSKNTLITSGVGNHQMMSAQFIDWVIPKSFISSGSLGVMGVGLPYSIGVQFANPNSLVIDIDGDGSFNHTLSELKTIVDYNLPIKIAVMNDGHMSMVRVWEDLFFDKRYTATNCNNNPLYHKLAESYGIKGIVCDNKKDLEEKIDYFLNYKGPILCNFKVETDKCLPLVAPGKALDEMILPISQTIKNHILDKSLPPS